MNEPLLDDEGENQAVRALLMLYGTGNHNIEAMRRHMDTMGFGGYWPNWIATASGHLTKAGAQSWLRHLFALEHASQRPLSSDGGESTAQSVACPTDKEK